MKDIALKTQSAGKKNKQTANSVLEGGEHRMGTSIQSTVDGQRTPPRALKGPEKRGGDNM